MRSIGQSQNTYRLLTTDLLSVAPQFMQRRRLLYYLFTETAHFSERTPGITLSFSFTFSGRAGARGSQRIDLAVFSETALGLIGNGRDKYSASASLARVPIQ